jgi:CRP-like cAMP-binding protein
MASPASSVLSPSQLELMARNGEERTAEAGEVLFRVGDRTYPFIVILDGEIVIQNPAGREIIRHGRNVFLGEMNLLSGQTVFLTATATRQTRYLAVERDVIRNLMFEDSALSDLLLSTFMRRREALQQEEGIGIEIFGPHSSPDTRRIVDSGDVFVVPIDDKSLPRRTEELISRLYDLDWRVHDVTVTIVRSLRDVPEGLASDPSGGGSRR